MELVNDIVESYAKQYTSPLDAVLEQIEKETLASHPHSQMLSGHVQGKLLEAISFLVRPVAVLEVGTFVGFSAICLAKGLNENGTLHTIELREEDAVTSRSNFEKAGMTDRIKLHVGDALTIIPTLKETWDMVFIDADKVNYINYYELTLPMLKSGGFIIADNVLFHGEVLEEEIKGKNAKAIDAFNRRVSNDDRTEQVMLTVRDGLMIIRKK